MCCFPCAVKVLDALSLEERFKKALPMLTRQIEGLKLLQKTRKTSPDNEKRVTDVQSLYVHTVIYTPNLVLTFAIPLCLGVGAERYSVPRSTVQSG